MWYKVHDIKSNNIYIYKPYICTLGDILYRALSFTETLHSFGILY